MKITPPFMYLLAFISGACALSYEVIWFRMLANICGSSVFAASIISAIFLTGLAIGSVWLGRVADWTPSPLRVFALLEIGIGVAGLVIPYLTTTAARLLAANQVPSSLILVTSVLLLLPPTILMGGTLPTLSKVIDLADDTDVLSRLYAVNTGGAAIGILGCSFFLLPKLGQVNSIIVAASANAIVAALALRLSKTNFTPLKEDPMAIRASAQGLQLLPLIATMIVGGCSLALEILWSRLFPLYIGNTTYAYALVLGCFLVGLACGSALYRRYLLAHHDRWGTILFLFTLFGLGVLATFTAFDRFSFIYYEIELAAGHNWFLLISLRALILAVVVFPATIASGALFPALLHLTDTDATVRGRVIGIFIGFNTAGSVIGSLAVPLAIIPLCGLQGGFRVVLLILAGLSLTIILRQRLFGIRQIIVPVALCLIAVWPFKWDQYLVNSGVYAYADAIKGAGGLMADREQWQMLFHSEGVDATVAVFQERATGVRSFIVNGKVDGGTADIPTQVLLGQLPMLLHSSPKEILVVGLGTGITLSETLKYPGVKSDCHEISPGVMTAATYFSSVNGSVFAHPQATIIRGDARSELLLNQKSYDVIISEPSNPWQSGNSRLFTRDFYQLAGLRLNQQGVFCQWLPIYDLPPQLLASAIATFRQQFPSTLGFLVNGTDLLLVGMQDGELTVDMQQLLARWQIPAIETTFRQIGFTDAYDLIMKTFVGGPGLLAGMTEGAFINTDNHNSLEFFRFHRDQHKQDNIQVVAKLIATTPPATRFAPMRFGVSASGLNSQAQLSQRYRLGNQIQEANAIQSIPR